MGSLIGRTVGITFCLVIVVAFTGIPTALAVKAVPWYVNVNGGVGTGCKYFVTQQNMAGSYNWYSVGGKFSSYSDAETYAANKFHTSPGVLFSC